MGDGYLNTGEDHTDAFLGGKAQDNACNSGGGEQTDPEGTDTLEGHQADGYYYNSDKADQEFFKDGEFGNAATDCVAVLILFFYFLFQVIEEDIVELDQDPSDRTN
ncbi:MAG: hypothetical protein LUE93_08220 [Bacteroides sp.]|nr:hypothetical protein [Bacteroides sp.]